LKHPEEIMNEVIASYAKEKERNRDDSFFNNMMGKQRKPWAIGAHMGGWLYSGDYSSPEAKMSGGLQLSYDTQNKFKFNIGVSRGDLATKHSYNRSFCATESWFEYRFNPHSNWTSYFLGGFGVLTELNIGVFEFDFSDKLYGKVMYGLGAEIMLNKTVGLDFSIRNNYLLNDKIDNTELGDYNDFYWEGRIGLNLYLDKIFKKKKKENKTKLINSPDNKSFNLPVNKQRGINNKNTVPNLEKENINQNYPNFENMNKKSSKKETKKLKKQQKEIEKKNLLKQKKDSKLAEKNKKKTQKQLEKDNKLLQKKKKENEQKAAQEKNKQEKELKKQQESALRKKQKKELKEKLAMEKEKAKKAKLDKKNKKQKEKSKKQKKKNKEITENKKDKQEENKS
jgi:hypothetical protein